MASSATPTDIRFEETSMWVSLSDGRTLGIPLSWFPVLERATAAQRKKFWLSPSGLHWDEIDEDISVQGLLDGVGDLTNRAKQIRQSVAE